MNTRPSPPPSFASFDAFMAHLNTVGLFHMDLRLDRTRNALHALVPKFDMAIVQVLGTNGKGSTSTFLAALARAHGLRTGLFTSPHFVSPRERIRINGQMLTEQVWLDWANKIHPIAPNLTYFEYITVLACCAFHEAGVQLAVMEAGLGGCHDATTALPVDILCYTPIAMDHESVLGDTLEAIAADKAAAIRMGAPVITGPQDDVALSCLQQAAAQAGNPLIQVHEALPEALPEALHLRMLGAHQLDNARLALATWQHLAQMFQLPTGPDIVRQALQEAFIPGRLHYIPIKDDMPALLLDGGHNPHGLQALSNALQTLPLHPQAVIFSCLADKDIEGMLVPLRHLAQDIPIFVPPLPDNPRAIDCHELAQRIGPQAIAVDSLSAALTRARQAMTGAMTGAVAQTTTPPPIPCLLICGSLYLLAEFFRLHEHCLTQSSPLPEYP